MLTVDFDNMTVGFSQCTAKCMLCFGKVCKCVWLLLFSRVVDVMRYKAH